MLNECLSSPGECRRSPSCRVHQVWKKARESLRGVLSGVIMADLVSGDNNGAQFCDVDIIVQKSSQL